MSPSAIPLVKRSLASLDSTLAIRTARHAALARTAAEVQAILEPVADAFHKAGAGPADIPLKETV
jgi:hypothetical protein